ncbi:hypothetical protein AVEN_176132-1, partial [Araneus ventricosus]
FCFLNFSLKHVVPSLTSWQGITSALGPEGRWLKTRFHERSTVFMGIVHAQSEVDKTSSRYWEFWREGASYGVFLLI